MIDYGVSDTNIGGSFFIMTIVYFVVTEGYPSDIS